MMHRLLKRQLKRLFGEDSEHTEDIDSLIKIINQTYHQFQDDYNQLERTLELSSKESFKELNDLKWAVNSAVIVTTADLKGNITYVNQNFCNVTGYNTSELLGASHKKINSKHHGKEFFSNLWDTILAGEVWKGEIKNKNKEGQYFWLDTVIIPFKNNLGLPFQFMSISYDITKRKSFEEEITKLALVAENTHSAVSVSDQDGTIIWINKGFSRLTEYSTEEILGKKPGTLLHGKKTDPNTIKLISDAINSLSECNCEIYNYSKSGKGYWLSTAITPMYDSNKNHIGFIAIETDITERKEVEHRLQENEKLLQAINFASSELLINNDFNNAIEKILKNLIENISIDKINIFQNEYLEDESPVFSHRYTFDNLKKSFFSNASKHQKLSYKELGYERWYSNFVNGNFIGGLTSSFPESEQAQLQPQNIVSVLLVPIMVSGNYWGFIGFDVISNEKSWSKTEIGLLQNFANSLGGAFERYEAESKLKESEEKFRLLIESASDIFYYSDAQGKFTYANEVSSRITGFSNQELLDMNYLDLVRHDFKKEVTKVYLRKKEHDNDVLYHEFPSVTKDNKVKWLGQNIQSINKNGILVGYQAIAREITALKMAQDEIISNNNFLDSILNSIPNPVFVKDRSHRWLIANEAYCKLINKKQEDIIGKTDIEFLGEELGKHYIKEDEKQFVTKIEFFDEGIFVNENKETKILLAKKSCFENAGGNYIIGVITDITNIKEREKQILLYNQITERINDAISVADWEGKLVYVNEAHAKNLGKKKEEIIGSTMMEMEKIFHTKKDWQQHFKEVKEKSELLIEGENIRSDGSTFPVEASIKYANIEGQELIIAAIRDITERKMVQQKLEQSENRFRSLVQNATDITTVISKEGNIIYESPSFYRVFGYTEDETLNQNIFHFVHPEDMPKVIAEFNRGIEKGGVSDLFEFRFKHKDGYYLNIESIGNNLVSNNEIGGLVVNSRDITERKKAEYEIKYLKDFYEKILNKIPSDIVVFDDKHRYMFINEIAINDLEKRTWAIGHNDYEYCDRYGRDMKLADARRDVFDRAYNSKQTYEYEESILKPDGSYKWMLRRMYPIVDNYDAVTNVIGFGIDITERKIAEEKLRESEERLLLATNAANLGIWDWNITNNILIWGKSMYDIFDIEPEKFSGDYDAFEKTLHPDDKTKVNKEIQYSINNLDGYKGDFRIINSKDEVRHVAAFSKLFKDHKNEPSRLIGVNFDITESKLAEEQILKYQQDLEEAQRIAKVGGWEIDISQHSVKCAKEIYNIYEIDEPISLSINEAFKYYTEETRTRFLEKFKNAIYKHEAFEIEGQIITQKGNYVDVRTKGIPEKRNGKLIISGILQDITSQKEIERKLVEYTNELERKNKELDQFAYIVSHDLKAPLRGINNLSMWIEEDLEGQMKGDVKTNFELLRTRVNRMESLINGILEYSRAGRMKPNPVDIDLNFMLKEILDSLAIPENFKIHVQDNLPRIHNERIAIEQVLTNYISNAIKYNSNENPEVFVRYQLKGHMHEFCIEDNGPGIAPEFHEKVFQIFQTLQSRDSFESTGVGLAIVKKIVEDKGGHVWLDSDLGQGTRFYFSLPDH
ncbi:MAG: PAS domain S-box protein [Bacteroidota bacterium]